MTLLSPHLAVFRPSRGHAIQFVDSLPGVTSQPYPFRVYVLSGGNQLIDRGFAGRLWRAQGTLPGVVGPPYGNGQDRFTEVDGTMTLTGPDTAVFRSGAGAEVRFVLVHHSGATDQSASGLAMVRTRADGRSDRGGILAFAQVLPAITTGRPEQPIAADSGQAKFHPHSGTLVGFRYHLKIYTHCGLASWGSPDFDGSYWDPLGVNSDGNGNPPPGVGNPFDEGTMVLLPDGRAEFTSQSGSKFLFARHVGDKVFAWCF